MESMRVLVASEDRAERALIGEALARRSDVGKVHYAADGVAAYVLIRREPPDLAILSAALPRVDGVVLVRLPALRAVTTLLILGADAADRVREVLQARPSGILVRPFDGEAFDARLGAILEMRAASILQDGEATRSGATISIKPNGYR
jgi:DNA-binding response OmpR family regulator